jgi:hypothetical protein
MSVKKYKVTLTENELDDLKQLVSKGKVSARKITHAQILLHANEGTPEGALKDTDIAKAIHISRLLDSR